MQSLKVLTRSKHMYLKYHYVQQAINNARIKIVPIELAKNPSKLLNNILALYDCQVMRKLILLERN